jgi:hypothetical protein
MLNITRGHLAKLELIKQRFLGNTCLPKPDNWKCLCNNEIWLKIIGQVNLLVARRPKLESQKIEKLFN